MDSKILKPTKEHNSKSYGPLATILQLHLTYHRVQVLYKFHWSRTTNIKGVKQMHFYFAVIESRKDMASPV